jgi:LPS export ABC transporter protein LptC
MVKLVVFLEGGDKIYLESEKGLLYAGTKDIDLWDSVRAKVPQGYQITTEKASYRHQERVIFSDTAVQLLGPDIQLKGTHWKYVLPEKRTFLEGNVEATFVLGSPGGGVQAQ